MEGYTINLSGPRAQALMVALDAMVLMGETTDPEIFESASEIRKRALSRACAPREPQRQRWAFCALR